MKPTIYAIPMPPTWHDLEWEEQRITVLKAFDECRKVLLPITHVGEITKSLDLWATLKEKKDEIQG